MPSWRASDGRGNPPVVSRGRRNGNGRRGFRMPGVLRFLLFAGVLAGIVLIVLLTALRPVARAGIVDWAWQNPSSIGRFPFVSDFVREDIGPALTTPVGTDPTESVFVVNEDDNIFRMAPRLNQEGFIENDRAFLYAALTGKLNEQLSAGTFLLRGNMTPVEVAEALVTARVTVTTTKITFREGLRIEQMTALLQTIDSAIDPQEFYDLATDPSAELRADYPWLVLPEGASLEGFLYPDTYEVITVAAGGGQPVTLAEDLIRLLLDRFEEVVTQERMTVPEERGLTFYEIVTLASIVEHEAIADEERALIAGVYQNRLDGLNGEPKIMNADPTITYVTDTLALEQLPFAEWQEYFFWKVPPNLADVQLPEKFAGYQTYQRAGLIPGPISAASVKSIDAALAPDQADGFTYFVAIPDKQTHAFAKTLREHEDNLRKYGYL